jgi:hypothetical protein
VTPQGKLKVLMNPLLEGLHVSLFWVQRWSCLTFWALEDRRKQFSNSEDRGKVAVNP